jgi:catechol 2,3-dioxygenase-like lactoylglutathione lyase family enzyme
MSMKEPIFKPIPILRIFDVDKAKAFYVDYLGFQFDWEHRFEPDAPAYLRISRPGLILHLTEHHGDCCPGGAVFIATQGLAALHRELTRKPYKYLNPGIEKAPWGDRMMELIDPFGNRLRFNQAADSDLSPSG